MNQNTYKYTVVVRCFTYNHSHYIEDALRGFAMQETTFPVVNIIVDDASTDGEQDVIKRWVAENLDVTSGTAWRDMLYGSLIEAPLRGHRNSTFVILLLSENHYQSGRGKKRFEYISKWSNNAKYHSICEGDDYWIAKDKLQKQVDFLDNHSDCGMVYTAYRLQNDITGVNTDVYTSDLICHDDTFKWKLLEQKVMVGTCTALIKAELDRKIKSIEDDYKGFLMGDTQTWFNAARLSGVGYIPEVTGVYRKQPSGATALFDAKRRISFIQNGLDMHLHLAYKYGAPKETVSIIKESYGLCLISSHIVVKEYDKAQNVNREYFNNNLAIKLYILTLKVLGITKSRGLGFISRHMYHNNVR